jgi:hypothetical protein
VQQVFFLGKLQLSLLTPRDIPKQNLDPSDIAIGVPQRPLDSLDPTRLPFS